MKPVSPKIIALLQARLDAEFGAVHIYATHAALARNMGLVRWAAHMEEEVLHEMEHVRLLTDRMLFMGGTISLAGKLEPGSVVAVAGQQGVDDPQQWVLQLVLAEDAAWKGYRDAAKAARELGDQETGLFFERLALEEQAHLSESETVAAQLKLMGVGLWASKQMHLPPAPLAED